ncbi:protein of unknown function [Ralstonia solanacearum CMR15]|nr:protein of unknown function [Ralstonia solanacearum CMR15]
MSGADTLHSMTPTQWLIIANLLLLFALKALCLLLGYGIVRIGASLLREGVRGEFKFHGSLPGAKGDLMSASPGLLFLLLGVWLIAFAMWVKKGDLGYERKTEIESTAPTSAVGKPTDSRRPLADSEEWQPAVPFPHPPRPKR